MEGLSLDAPARGHGIHVLAPERPGYGRSDYWRAETVIDWCAALLEIPDRSGVDRFSVLGVSGGGPYALGLGYLCPQRVDTLTLVSSRGLGFMGGMPGLPAAFTPSEGTSTFSRPTSTRSCEAHDAGKGRTYRRG